MNIVKILSFVCVAATIFTGCPSANSGVVFSRNEALHAQNVLLGTVVDVRAGKIEGTKSAAGALAGGALGAVTGNLIGGGRYTAYTWNHDKENQK